MTRRRPLVAIAAVAAAVIVLLAACGDDEVNGPTIRAAGFNFRESHVISWIYAIALEEEGYPVDTSAIEPGRTREIVKRALESNDVDYVPEYVGTLLRFLGGEPTADGAFNHAEAQQRFLASGVTVLDFAPGEDANVFVVTEEFARANEARGISDLVPIADQVVFGGPPECPQRAFCLLGLRDVYGVDPGEFVPLSDDARVAALRDGEINVALLFSTQPVIADEGWVVLEDDRGLIPAENVAMAIRSGIVEEYGDDLVSVINEVTAALTTEVLTTLNGRLAFDSPEHVARAWLKEHDLI
jgi:osmoprotectant transport system substrate-binding protein